MDGQTDGWMDWIDRLIRLNAFDAAIRRVPIGFVCTAIDGWMDGLVE